MENELIQNMNISALGKLLKTFVQIKIRKQMNKIPKIPKYLAVVIVFYQLNLCFTEN